MAIITPVFTHFDLASRRWMTASTSLWRSPSPTRRPGRRACRACREKKSEDHGGPHVPVHRARSRRSRSSSTRGRLGDLYYFDSMRVNLGLFQHDVNVIWDLAPHDLSIMDYLIDEKPSARRGQRAKPTSTTGRKMLPTLRSTSRTTSSPTSTSTGSPRSRCGRR